MVMAEFPGKASTSPNASRPKKLIQLAGCTTKNLYAK
jgi:hypothetical protein